MLNKLIKTTFVILVVLSLARPVSADTDGLHIIRSNRYELGNSDVRSYNIIPTEKNQGGIFSIEYKIEFRMSTTEAVRPTNSAVDITETLLLLGLSPEQIDPDSDYIFAEWQFGDGIKFSQRNNIPAPISGDGWCGQRDVRLICAFPSNSIIGTRYQIQVYYTPTVDCVCQMAFNTNYSGWAFHSEIENIVIPVFTNTVYLPLIGL